MSLKISMLAAWRHGVKLTEVFSLNRLLMGVMVVKFL